jgi:hypothetical protein
MSKTYTPGDRIAYAAKWLRDTGQFTGSIPFRRGTYIGPAKHAEKTHARVKWDDIESYIASGVCQYGDAEYIADIRANGSLVALSAIAKVGTPRFASNDIAYKADAQ